MSRRFVLRRNSLQSVLALVPSVFVALSSTLASADIIIDDFDDPVQVITPIMQGQFVATQNVGDLKAERRVRITALQGNPSGFLDSNISSPSTLTAQITKLNPIPFGETLASIQSNYAFPTSDFEQSGQNNALLFDFQKSTSEMPPSFFMILLRDNNDVFLYLERPVSFSSEPFTLVAPFDGFTFRDGETGSPNFTSVREVNVELRASALAGGGPDPLNFFVQLDRIRIGRIPEPSTVALYFWGLFTVGMTIFRRPTNFGPIDGKDSSTNEGLEPAPVQPSFPPGFPVPAGSD
jgi:hypothetical protein